MRLKRFRTHTGGGSIIRIVGLWGPIMITIIIIRSFPKNTIIIINYNEELPKNTIIVIRSSQNI